MRVSKKEIHDQQVIVELLTESPVGRLGTIGRDGCPMIKPLNFIYYHGKIYFHSAQEGEKIEQIQRDGRVCFEVDLPLAYVRSRDLPCRADYLYRSVIIKGRAHLVADREEKVSALKALMQKYQPEGGYSAFSEEKLTLTAVVRIDIGEMTAKEDLGTMEEREAVLGIIQHRLTPPTVLERS
jgi:nitroimidazol reductase NimA-like FMN-containing flavoprotein (pyridoxamine 5'-phosphate oxidase superfamily)